MARVGFINILLLPTLIAHGLPQTAFLGQVPQEEKSYCAGFNTEADCAWAPEVRCSWHEASGTGTGECKCLYEDCKAFDLCALLSDNRTQCLDYSLPNGAKCKWGPSEDYPTANCTCEEEGCKTPMPKCSSELACESDCQCVDGFCQPLPGCSQFSMDDCEGQSANGARCCLGSSTNASDLPCGFCSGSHPVCAAPTNSLGSPQTAFLSPIAQKDKSYCADFKTEADCSWAPEVRCSWHEARRNGTGECKCLYEDCKAFDLCALLSDNRTQCLDCSLPNGAKCKWGPSEDYPTANCTCEEEGCKTPMPKCSSELACESDCQCVDGFCQPLPGCSQFSMDECEGQSANNAKCCLGSSTNASDLPCGFCSGSHPVCAAPTNSLGSPQTALLGPVSQEEKLTSRWGIPRHPIARHYVCKAIFGHNHRFLRHACWWSGR